MGDDKVGVLRVKGCAVQDGSLGWITVVGNCGSVFLEESGGMYEVLKETMLTVGFELEGSELVRALKEGDRLEVLEWDRKDETSGSVRLRVKVKGESAVGWVTKVLKDDT